MVVTFLAISLAIVFSLYRCVSSTCDQIEDFRSAAFDDYPPGEEKKSKPSLRQRTDSYFRRRPSDIMHDDDDLCSEVKVDLKHVTSTHTPPAPPAPLHCTDKPRGLHHNRRRRLRTKRGYNNKATRLNNSSESFPECSSCAESGIDNIGYQSASSGEDMDYGDVVRINIVSESTA